MSRELEPLLHPVAIDDLRPTQMTVGMREVERKRKEWAKRAPQDGPDFLGRHLVPVVVGPKHRAWIVDHHHLVRALHEEGQQRVLVTVIADLRRLDPVSFLTFMDNRNWLHPFDAKGRRHGYDAIPKHIGGLTDDPYRSLAGSLRRAGGYAKDNTAYSEFLWADFLRRRVARRKVEDRFKAAVTEALALANSRDADHLPGWAGIKDGE